MSRDCFCTSEKSILNLHSKCCPLEWSVSDPQPSPCLKLSFEYDPLVWVFCFWVWHCWGTPGLVTNSTLFAFYNQARINAKVRFFTPTQTRFASVVLRGFDGLLSLARHNWQCLCFSIVPEATCKARLIALEGRCVISKSPISVRDQDEGVAIRNSTLFNDSSLGLLIRPLVQKSII